MFVSDYFQLDEAQFEEMCSMGVFDALLDRDSNFFINIIRLKESSIPEFIDAYHHVNQYFNNIATLLDAAETPTTKDKMYRSARAMFRFHEVNGINLGFSKSRYGSGWGELLSDMFCADAYQIVKKGSKQPELFHLVSLFEADVGPDRLSDMIATIIEPQIVKYTLRIMKELGITPETRPNLLFLENGLVQNPNKASAILLLPTEVLHQLPIAKDWDDIDRVVTENNTIRQEVSAEVGAEWTRWASVEQKQYLKTHVFMDPAVCSRVIDGYRQRQLSAIDLKEDTNYLVELLLKKLKKADAFKRKIEYPSSVVAARGIIDIFKDWVENNRGWEEIQNAPNKNREKAVQRFMHLGAKYYVEKNNLDISCEPDDGRGPVDIKLSRGQDKTLIEVKLSSNGQYLHGYETQIEEYGKAERTRNLIYVFVDIGNPGRRKALIELHDYTAQSGTPCPDLVIIDAQSKKAASTYTTGSELINQEDVALLDWDKSFEELEKILSELPEIDLKEFPSIGTDELGFSI